MGAGGEKPYVKIKRRGAACWVSVATGPLQLLDCRRLKWGWSCGSWREEHGGGAVNPGIDMWVDESGS